MGTCPMGGVKNGRNFWDEKVSGWIGRGMDASGGPGEEGALIERWEGYELKLHRDGLCLRDLGW